MKKEKKPFDLSLHFKKSILFATDDDDVHAVDAHSRIVTSIS